MTGEQRKQIQFTEQEIRLVMVVRNDAAVRAKFEVVVRFPELIRCR